MEMAKLYMLYAISLQIAFVLVHGQDQQGFISIDCGAPNDYTDEITDINYSTDDGYIETGVSKTISPEFNVRDLYKRFSNVRSFPEETNNCYTLRPAQGRNHSYLIRASFMYGNYDAKRQLPKFDLYLGVNKWRAVELKDESSLSTYEIIYVPKSDFIHVCLVNTNSGTPFISALESRLLNSGSYVTKSGSLELFSRGDCGSPPNQFVRYKDDSLDRIWVPENDDSLEVLNLNSLLPVTPNTYEPPSVVLTTVVTPKNVNESGLKIYWTSEHNVSTHFYIYLHFTEIIKDLQTKNQTRLMNIFVNDKHWYGPFFPNYLRAYTVYSRGPETGSHFEIWINKTENSTLRPTISAFEIYTVKQLLFSLTDQNDVDALMNTKSFYGLKIRNWQGDPCGPVEWKGLNCSHNAFDPPRIFSLNLSSSGLTGSISPYISDLTLIQMLDLSNNALTGMVPDFLSHMPNLRVLNLQRNNLSGTLPLDLYDKSKNGVILLSADGNPYLCLTNSCDEKKKDKKSNNSIAIPVAASVGGFAVVLIISVAVFYGLRRRKQAAVPSVTSVNVEFNIKKDEELEEIRKQHFTYAEVLTITKNFERVIGKGGFGTVYHGYLNNSEVAIKMLSRSSMQGFKEFHAEAKLLTRVYHRNLTSLVGYCDESPNMGLIYEYMSNGDLAWHLSDRNPHPPNWEERLKILMDAAQGLEYLHNGCKPPMIHRDVKTTNILLNEKLQAKLSDFGLSRAFLADGDSHVSTVVVGTPGYLDPEYYVSNRLTEKSDVFSFGVVMLETITGRRAINKNAKIRDQKGHIIEWVECILSKGDIDSIADPRLDQQFDKNCVWKAVEVAMACASPTSIRRPTMTHVAMELKQCLAMEMGRTVNSDVTESSELPEMFRNAYRGPQSR